MKTDSTGIARRIAGGIFIIMGILLISIPISCRIHGKNRTEQMMGQFEEILVMDTGEETADTPREQAEEEDSRTVKKAAVLSERDAELFTGEDVIGIIEIKALDIRYPVLEGAGSEQIKYAIGHIPETAGIGTKGNCVLCGHNGSRNGTFFTCLNRIKTGDEVRIIDRQGEVHLYEAAEMFVTDAYDNTVKNDSGEEVLTLLTCADHGTKRFICRCTPVCEGGDTIGQVE